MHCERFGVLRSTLFLSYFNKEHSIYDFFLSDWEYSENKGCKKKRKRQKEGPMDGGTEGRRRNTGRLSSGNVHENFG